MKYFCLIMTLVAFTACSSADSSYADFAPDSGLYNSAVSHFRVDNSFDVGSDTADAGVDEVTTWRLTIEGASYGPGSWDCCPASDNDAQVFVAVYKGDSSVENVLVGSTSVVAGNPVAWDEDFTVTDDGVGILLLMYDKDFGEDDDLMLDCQIEWDAIEVGSFTCGNVGESQIHFRIEETE